MLAPTPCLTAGCRNHTVSRGYCKEHQPALVFRSHRKHDLPKDWNTRRAVVLRRDNSTCYLCGQTATQVDHVEPGNNHNLNNLKAICHKCHMSKTAQEGNDAKRGNRPRPRF